LIVGIGNGNRDYRKAGKTLGGAEWRAEAETATIDFSKRTADVNRSWRHEEKAAGKGHIRERDFRINTAKRFKGAATGVRRKITIGTFKKRPKAGK